MRQGDGSDLLGQSDPRNADIGILYIGPEDSRQEILTAINAQELQGRKQIAIVLPEQGKAFRQPVEFDGLKNMRRGLKAQLIFIAPPGPGPAEFARHRRFVVYSSLETFRTALINEGALYNPRGKAVHGSERRSGALGKGRMSKERDRNAPPPLVVPAAQLPPAMPPTPPTPRIVPAASAQPAMPPTPPTPHSVPQATGPDRPVGSPISPMPQIEDMKTNTLEFEAPEQGQGSGAALVAGAGLGALAASALDDDDDLAPVPPMTPRQPSGGAPSGGLSGKTPDARRSPAPLLLGQQTNTPRPGGSGKLPAATARGSQTRTGSGKQPPAQGRSTKQLSPTQGVSDAPKPPNGQGGSGKLPAALPIGAAAMAVGAASGSEARSAAGNPPIPAAMAVTGTPGGPGPRQSGLTPLPAPVSQRKRRVSRRRRLVLFLLLGLLTLAVIGGILVSALGGPAGLATFGRLTATVSITPQSQYIQNKYVISGVTTAPNAAQHQVSAHVLPAQSGTQQGTHGATGSIPAKSAQGLLTFQNVGAAGVTLGTTVLTGGDGVQIKFFGPVFVPATGSASATVTGYAVNGGSAGNIQSFDINGKCCAANIFVKNTNAFAGGQDAQPNSIIQQSDIDGAANSVMGQLKTSAQAALQKQVKSNERVADGSLQCKPTTQANHKAGDSAPSVSVSVTVACTEEVFDFAAAQQMASNLLITDQPSGVNLAGYKLVGAIIPSLESATVSSVENQVAIIMQAAGRWVYQFSSQQQQLIKQKLVTHSKADALNILKGYVGLASASINISTGSIMPATASDITISLVTIPGLSPGTPIVTATSYVPVGGTPTVGTPTGKGTPSGGS